MTMTPQDIMRRLEEDAPVKILEWKCSGLLLRDRVPFTPRGWKSIESDVVLGGILQPTIIVQEIIVTSTPSLDSFDFALPLSPKSDLICERLEDLKAKDSHVFAKPWFINGGTRFVPELRRREPFIGDAARQSIQVELYGWEITQQQIKQFKKEPLRSVVCGV